MNWILTQKWQTESQFLNYLRRALPVIPGGGGGSITTFTTTGSSGAATYNSSTGALNIPIYTAGVSGVSNVDNTLTISPTTGAVVASLNLSQANSWGANQTFPAIIVGSGGQSTPSIKFSGQTTGFYSNATNQIALTGGGGNLAVFSNQSMIMADWSNGGFSIIAPRDAGSGNNNRAGMSMIIQGGQSTGNQLGGGIFFQTAAPSGSGGTLNSLLNRISIDGNGLISMFGAMVYNITLQAGTTYTISALDHTVVGTGTTSTWTFPTVNTGRLLVLVNHGSGTITLGTAVTTATGTTTTTLTAGSRMTIQYDATVWRQIAG